MHLTAAGYRSRRSWPTSPSPIVPPRAHGRGTINIIPAIRRLRPLSTGSAGFVVNATELLAG